jgi:multidrug resistance efflux pump
MARAQVDLNEAQRDFERKQSLVQMQFIAQSEADRARALVNTTTEALKADTGPGRCDRGADQDGPAPMWRSA